MILFLLHGAGELAFVSSACGGAGLAAGTAAVFRLSRTYVKTDWEGQ
jgi:hypothetical protein